MNERRDSGFRSTRVPRFLGFLRGVALIAAMIGATGSFVLMLRGGHPPLFLRVLFAGWVLSPFVAVGLADRRAKRWPVPARATLYGVTLVLVVGSLVFYQGMIPMPDGSRPAAVFLVVPAGSWTLLIAVLVAAFAARRLPRRTTRGAP